MPEREPIKELLKRPGVYGVKNIDIHENFKQDSGIYNDLAILTLAKPITFTSGRKKGKLQTKGDLSKSKSTVKLRFYLITLIYNSH